MSYFLEVILDRSAIKPLGAIIQIRDEGIVTLALVKIKGIWNESSI